MKRSCHELFTSARAVILDFDGVIVDSEHDEKRAWETATSVLQIVIERPIDTAGKLDEDIAREILGHDKRTAERLLAIKNEALEEIRGHGLPPLVPGVVALIERCEKDGKPLAVASNSAFDTVVRTLDAYRLHGRFRAIAGYGELPAKPSPAIYVAVLDQLGLDPVAAVAIEDSPTGIMAARRAGVPCIGLAHGRPREPLLTAGAECIIERFDELFE